MTLSIRLDPDAKFALEDIARRRSTTQSELVRKAIDELIRQENSTPYERVLDLIGSVDAGPTDLSESTGLKFRELLESRSP